MKFLSFLMYLFEKFKTLNLIKETIKINKILSWSITNTKFIDQFNKLVIGISKKMISDCLLKRNAILKDEIIIDIRNHVSLLIKHKWNFNI